MVLTLWNEISRSGWTLNRGICMKKPGRKQMKFINAYTFGFCEKQGFTQGRSWQQSLKLMADSTGCNAIILPVCAWQDHAFSTQLDSVHPDVMSAEDVRNVCGYARELGLGIILKAMVNCRDGYWRAYIRFFDQEVPVEPGWREWFPSWSEHVKYVAAMAEENHADMFCIGCGLVGTDHRELEWRELISEVRQIYSGPLTYNCDKYQEDHIVWWDALDVISSSGYYPVDDLDRQFERIHEVAERFRKPFMFMECGCPSRYESENRPNDWNYGKGISLESQERWYKAFLEALEHHPFIRGTGWWDWSATRLYPEYAGADNSGYCTWGKPANDLIRKFSETVVSESDGLLFRIDN